MHSGWCWTSSSGPSAPQLRQWRHWSWHQLEFPGRPCFLSNSPWRLKLVAKQSLPVESRLGWLSPPAEAVWLWVSKARQWCSPVAVHRYPGPWFIWLQLQTSVTCWSSSKHWRQTSGPGQKTPKLPDKLGRSNICAKTQVWNTLSFKFVCTILLANLNHHDWRSLQFLVLLLCSLFN